MLRAHHIQGESVTAVARRFGVSRQTFYTMDAAFQRVRWKGLVRAKPGPREPIKVTAACAQFLADEHRLRPDASWQDWLTRLHSIAGWWCIPALFNVSSLRKTASDPTRSSGAGGFLQTGDRLPEAYANARPPGWMAGKGGIPCRTGILLPGSRLLMRIGNPVPQASPDEELTVNAPRGCRDNSSRG